MYHKPQSPNKKVVADVKSGMGDTPILRPFISAPSFLHLM